MEELRPVRNIFPDLGEEAFTTDYDPDDSLSCKPDRGRELVAAKPADDSTSTFDFLFETTSIEKARNSRMKRIGKGKIDTLYRVGCFMSASADGGTATVSSTTAACSSSSSSTRSNTPLSTEETCSVSNQNDFSFKNKGEHQFVKGLIEGFWECSQCRTLPISARAKHSVMFHASEEPPQGPTIRFHLQKCPKALSEAKANGIEITKDDCVDKERKELSELSESPTAAGASPLAVRRKRGRPRKHESENRGRKKIQRKPPPPPTSPSSLKETLKTISIPPTDNALIESQDSTITATIDILLMSQVERCKYVRSEDTIAYLRNKPLPEDFPGVECKYCTDKKKRWFFNTYTQVATGFPKIEQHLLFQCRDCPKEVKRDLSTAKSQEDLERFLLRTESETGEKATRRQYAGIVFDRLGAFHPN